MSDSQRWLLLTVFVLVGALVYLLEPILFPFLVSLLLAYLWDPVVDRLEARGCSRTWGVVVVFALVTLLALLAVLLVVPMLGRQLSVLVQKVPLMIDWLENVALPWLQVALGIDVSALDLSQVKKVITANWQKSTDLVGSALGSVTRSGLAFAGWIANLVLIPVVTFYLLRDWDLMIGKLGDLLPRSVEPKVARWARECDEVLGAFMKGQLLVMLCLGVVYAVGLSIIGLDLALVLGMVAGLASIVPYMGFVVGIAASLIAAMMQFGDPLYLVFVALVFGAGQALEGMVLTPLLVGDKIGLHPVAVIFAIMAGGQLFGFTGILLALPVAAVIMVLLRHLHEGYRDSPLYHARPAPVVSVEKESD
ncbi:AI-2E family transporter [Motiliproteus sediminis]|uniref:AI-2E family transporter n=1 Tax=Motiliproteus sediminis TaxID=1468178 RepID=UPI001AF012A3|nr:AI-2E family transporter [Motiliproteus sediminis]